MSRRAARRGVVFWAAIGVVFYAFLSLGLAVVTADTCGDLDAQKEWKVIPPEWDCTP